jgi:hypothetical protein
VRFAAHYGFRPDLGEAADPESKRIVEHLAGYAGRDLIVPAEPSVTYLATANAVAVGWCAEVYPDFPAHGPATLKGALLNGRLTVEELVDRYKIRHAGVRHLLIAYLERRKPELDYSTLDNLSRHLASNFWATIEQLAPGQPGLRIDGELYQLAAADEYDALA